MGVKYNPKITTDGLVGCWDCGNVNSYSGSGTTLKDLSGLGNTGTLNNSPTFASSSLTFNGTNQTVFIPNSFQLGATSFTIEIWLSILNTSLDAKGIFSWNDDGFNTGAKGLSIRFRSGSNSIEYGLNDGVGTATRLTQSGFQGNTWYQLVYTHSYNSTVTAYQNGVPITTVNYFTEGNSSFSNTYPFVVAYCGNGYLNMSLSNIKVYNRALTPIDVKQNFNALRGRFGL